MIDLVGDDEQVLDEEQAVNRQGCRNYRTSGKLRPEAKAASLAACSMDQCVHLGKRLRRVEIGLRRVNEAVKPLVPGPGLDDCLLQQFEERITSLKAELEDITEAAVVLEDEGLLEQHTTLE